MFPSTVRTAELHTGSSEWPIRRIALLVFPKVHLMNLAGPVDVFVRASHALIRQGKKRTVYELDLLTMDDSPLITGSGFGLLGGHHWTQAIEPIDTLLVFGGAAGIKSSIDPELLSWLRSRADRVRRIGSVCAGAFVLAAAGILDGRRATTHWEYADRLAHNYPKISVDADRIYIQDGNVWTSAGVSAGVDLALAMVEEDHGHKLALEIARHMVMFLRRPGGQSQFSSQLAAQAADHQPIRELVAWISENLNGDLSVPTLARRAGMSERNFSRIFTRQVGATPARFVARLRLEAAKVKLESTNQNVETIASQAGLGDGETLRRLLRSTTGVTPRSYRARVNAS
jgi:transcriptional regulator GlxA family with amidase domain